MNKQLALFDVEVLRSKLADGPTPGLIAELGPAEAEAESAVEHALTESRALERSRDEFSLELFP